MGGKLFQIKFKGAKNDQQKAVYHPPQATQETNM